MKIGTIKTILIIILIGIIVFLLKDCIGLKKKDPYWKNPNFKTDTFYLDKPYKVKGDSFPYYVPPMIVIEYLKDTTNKNSIKCINDSLISVIDSLGKQLSLIDKSFLTQFPNSPKLIGGSFSLDTFKLDLLKIDGSIITSIYPVDYPNYQYQWYDNKIRAIDENKINPNITHKNIQWVLYGNMGYEFLSKSPFISMDANIIRKNLRLSAEPRINIKSQPELGFDIKLGYKIK